jgi:hypothetical protein
MGIEPVCTKLVEYFFFFQPIDRWRVCHGQLAVLRPHAAAAVSLPGRSSSNSVGWTHCGRWFRVSAPVRMFTTTTTTGGSRVPRATLYCGNVPKPHRCALSGRHAPRPHTHTGQRSTRAAPTAAGVRTGGSNASGMRRRHAGIRCTSMHVVECPHRSAR